MAKQTENNAQDLELWQKVLQRIKSELSEQSFKAWFESLQISEVKSGKLRLSVPDKFYGDWIKDHYQDLIKSAWFALSGEKPAIEYILREEEAGPKKRAARHLSHSKKKDLQLNKRFTFDSFVVGPSNRFAFAAAQAIGESPAKSYNPFFVYGPVGLGKTHLLQAIARDASARYPEKKIVYTSSERFVNQLIAAIQSRQTPTFRSTYRDVDVLLIDDIHFIAGKDATQTEFFHTFNALYDAHKQIVVSSDRAPKEIPGLEERLVSRFEWGLITDVQPPDLETRVAILKKKLENEKILVPEDVVFFVASKVKSNIRELEGAMLRVTAYSSLTGSAITLDIANKVLKETLKEEEARLTIDHIQKTVADYFKIRVSDLRAKKRSRTIVFPRQVAMYLIRKLTKYSLPEIGEYFGGRDHSTVIHACKKIEKGESKKNYKDILKNIESLIREC